MLNKIKSEPLISRIPKTQTPAVVYHYTTMSVLQSIVGKREIWATNAKYLNDVSEYQVFFSEVKKRLPSLAYPANLAEKLTSGTLTSDFREVPFVASFAREKDSLTHWRSYCPVGNGVSIGFRTKCLEQASTREPARPLPGMIILYPSSGMVQYMLNRAQLDDAIKTAYQRVQDTLIEHPEWAATISIPKEFSRWIELMAMFRKHKSFVNECEFRLCLNHVNYRQDLLEFRSSRSTLVPYVPLQIPSLSGVVNAPWDAIEHVIVGPTPNMALSVEALKAFFQIHAMDVKVSASRVPYRDW